jgi:predicted nucleic-acid-binding protein
LIGLDTNVLVRYLTHDEPAQTAAAMRVMNSLSLDSPAFLSLIVIAELVWVLAISYRYRKTEIEEVLENLLRSKELVIERADIVSQASRAFRAGTADFADYLIARCGDAAECQFTLTFDRKAATVAGMRLLR